MYELYSKLSGFTILGYYGNDYEEIIKLWEQYIMTVLQEEGY